MGGKPSKGTKRDKRLKSNKRAAGNSIVGRLVPPRKRKG